MLNAARTCLDSGLRILDWSMGFAYLAGRESDVMTEYLDVLTAGALVGCAIAAWAVGMTIVLLIAMGVNKLYDHYNPKPRRMR